jgi:hypothetical protein
MDDIPETQEQDEELKQWPNMIPVPVLTDKACITLAHWCHLLE